MGHRRQQGFLALSTCLNIVFNMHNANTNTVIVGSHCLHPTPSPIRSCTLTSSPLSSPFFPASPSLTPFCSSPLLSTSLPLLPSPLPPLLLSLPSPPLPSPRLLLPSPPLSSPLLLQLKNVRQGLAAQSSSYLLMAEQCQKLYTTQQHLVDMIPTDHTQLMDEDVIKGV